jgi:hypothetical protein
LLPATFASSTAKRRAVPRSCPALAPFRPAAAPSRSKRRALPPACDALPPSEAMRRRSSGARAAKPLAPRPAREAQAREDGLYGLAAHAEAPPDLRQY